MPELMLAVAAALVVIGLAGTVLPWIPGVPLVFGGLVVAAWAEGFTKVGVPTLVVLGILTAISVVVDMVATAYGAHRLQASKLALVGASLGTLVGIFFGIPGLIVGPFIGAAAGEWLARRNLKKAGTVGLGTWLGIVLGAAAKLTIVFCMIGIFTLAYVI